MNRSEDNTCEYCRGDLPRGSATHFCSEECFEANEREAREQAERFWVGNPPDLIEASCDRQ
jgi:hypothetical protein